MRTLTWNRERILEMKARITHVRLPFVGIPLVPAASPSAGVKQALQQGFKKAFQNVSNKVDRLEFLTHSKKAEDPMISQGLHRKTIHVQRLLDTLFYSLDLLTDIISTRADVETGQILSGIDRLVQRAFSVDVPGYKPPLALSYMDAGRGGAIRRARTTLPGSIVLPVALLRVGRVSVGSRLTSMLHESGHQLSVDLNLLPEARWVIGSAATKVYGKSPLTQFWQGFAGELMSDVWSFGFSGGAPAIDGLQRVLSLPRHLLVRARPGQVHPPGMVRVEFALEFVRHSLSDPTVEWLEKRWKRAYGKPSLEKEPERITARLMQAARPVAHALANHRFAGLGRRTVLQACGKNRPRPEWVAGYLQRTKVITPQRLARLDPLKSLAILGFAKILGRISPLEVEKISRSWLKIIAAQNVGINKNVVPWVQAGVVNQ